MKSIALIFVFFLLVCASQGQQRVIDSLAQLPANNDTLQLVRYNLLIEAWSEVSEDSAVVKAEQYLQLSKKLNYSLNEADALQHMALGILEKNPVNALEIMFKAEKLIQDNHNKKVLPKIYLDKLHFPKIPANYESYRLYIMGKINIGFGIIYWANSSSKSLSHFLRALEIAKTTKAADLLVSSYLGLGTYFSLPRLTFSKLIYLSTSSYPQQF